MNVVLLAPLPPPHGGISGWTIRMKNTRLKNGWHVKVVDEKVTGKRDAYSTKRNYYQEYQRCRRIWNDLKEALTDSESVIVQACIPAGFFSMLREIVSARIARRNGAKFIIHFRCTLPNMVKKKSEIFVFRHLMHQADCAFVLNNASADFLKTIIPNSRYKVIPNFIELGDLGEKKNYCGELKTFVYVGGVIPEKGCDMLAKVAEKMPGKEFRLIGKVGMDTSSFPSNITLLGEQKKDVVQSELKNADAFLFLTRYYGEGFSNALAEAMSNALPCIVSDWAANKDMIENKGGIVLKHYSVNDVVDAIHAIEDSSVRQKMGEWNREKVRNQYSDVIITSQYVDAYEELLR